MAEPILVAIAAALAGKGASSLYELVRRKFGRNEEAVEALEAARGAAPESDAVVVLSERLESAEREDPEFAAKLRTLWQDLSVHQRVDGPGVANHISGGNSGQVAQARDIQGGVSF